MKKIFNLALALGLILSMPMFLTADEQEVEIQLVEVMGVLPGDDPFDNPIHSEPDPTIAGRYLAVTSDNANATQVIVRNASGNVVLNRQFVGFTAEQLSASGAHSIEIHNGGLTLVGNFQAQ